MDGLPGFEWTEEKITALKPIIESILTRKYGKEVKFKDLTIDGITVDIRKDYENDKSGKIKNR